ncbi:hypothetical protein CDCA_CDCA15G3987 [Cyanidium caldarium]|uniref:Nucleotide-diphospho-sugar transferase domain-containing protein n=1 Tax=Cyanidium caldarium TaxID=2771 RepID=A0AAV9J046_CYACA|nr:hypothetical protein CDCA_CDCA15G3987 [Cyanidium caldarium]
MLFRGALWSLLRAKRRRSSGIAGSQQALLNGNGGDARKPCIRRGWTWILLLLALTALLVVLSQLRFCRTPVRRVLLPQPNQVNFCVVFENDSNRLFTLWAQMRQRASAPASAGTIVLAQTLHGCASVANALPGSVCIAHPCVSQQPQNTSTGCMVEALRSAGVQGPVVLYEMGTVLPPLLNDTLMQVSAQRQPFLLVGERLQVDSALASEAVGRVQTTDLPERVWLRARHTLDLGYIGLHVSRPGKMPPLPPRLIGGWHWVYQHLGSAQPHLVVDGGFALAVASRQPDAEATSKLPPLAPPQSRMLLPHELPTDDRAPTSDAQHFYHKLWSRADAQRNVALLYYTVGYEKLMQNWICWCERIGFRHYLIVVNDAERYAALTAAGIPAIHDAVWSRSLPHNAAKTSADYGTVDFQRIMTRRTLFLERVLLAGFHLLSADLDSVWLQDPFPHMDPQCDLSGQAHNGKEISGGFVHVRNHDRSRQLWARVAQCQLQNLDSLEASPKQIAKLGGLHEQQCINDIAAEMEAKHLLRRCQLHPRRFPDGRAFFEQHQPQKDNYYPVVIHNNWIVGTAAKEARFQKHGLWLAQSGRHGGCMPASAHPAHMHIDSRAPLRLLVRVLCASRPAELAQALQALRKVVLDPGDRLDVEISVDYLPGSAANQQVRVLAGQFEWPHGRLRKIFHTTHQGLQGQWLRPYDVENDGHLLMVLEDDVVLSPMFYRWVKEAVRRYYLNATAFDPQLFGVMLQRQHAVMALRRHIKNATPSDLQQVVHSGPLLFRYPLLCTWGPVFFPRHWHAFLLWQEEKRRDPAFVPCVPGLETNLWYLRNMGATAWSPYFVRYAFDHGLYGLYFNLNRFHAKPEQALSLAVNTRPDGLNYHGWKGPIGDLITFGPERVDWPDVSHIPTYDFASDRWQAHPHALALLPRLYTRFPPDACYPQSRVEFMKAAAAAVASNQRNQSTGAVGDASDAQRRLHQRQGNGAGSTVRARSHNTSASS